MSVSQSPAGRPEKGQDMSEPTKLDYYKGPQAGDFAEGDEPFDLFEAWFAEAATNEPNDPNAMALATVDAAGVPNVRMVLLKGVDGPERPDRGFVFYTNLESTKGRELLASGKAALCFHWKSLRRQVRLRGSTTLVSEEEADAYFANRPRARAASRWKRPLPGSLQSSALATFPARPTGRGSGSPRSRWSSGTTGRSGFTIGSRSGAAPRPSHGARRASIRERRPISRGRGARRLKGCEQHPRVGWPLD